jgi:hypothetical protein
MLGETFADAFAFMAGVPAMVGLILAAATIFLTSDWRLSLTALLAQYVLVGLALTRSIQAEVAIVKILVGVLVVVILYLSGRQAYEARDIQRVEKGRAGPRLSLGLHVEWGAGPLGLPLRMLTTLLVALAVIRFVDEFSLLLPVLRAENATIPPDMAIVAFWLGGMGLVGLVLTGDPLRVAAALLTILAGFDLIYASVEPSLAVVGFLSALTLMAALAFSYLAVVHGLGVGAGRARLGTEYPWAAAGPAPVEDVPQAAEPEEGTEP